MQGKLTQSLLDSLVKTLRKTNILMKTNKTITKWINSAILVTSLIAAQAMAKDYKVEVLLFDNNNPSKVTESHDYVAPKPMRSNSETWELEPSMLLGAADALEKSSDYTLQNYFSWGQNALPYRSSASYNVIERETQGFIKVYADSLLFVNIDLDHKGFRLSEKRRLKLNEKHFFDHPKFGVLIQVSRLLPKIETEEDEPEDSEQQNEAVSLERSR